MHKTIALALGVALSFSAATATGQESPADYPRRPVKLVTPLGAGSAADVLARLIALKLGEAWGQQVIVENRPGAAGTVGASLVSKMPGDGYTLLLTTNAPLTTNLALYKKLDYGWQDFDPVMLVVYAPVVLMVNPRTGINSIAELVATSKSKPGGLSVATTGNGSIGHFLITEWRSKLGANLVNVAYKGGAPGSAAVASGETEAGVLDTGGAGPFIRDGRVRALGIVGEQRSSAFPEIPTLAEMGAPGANIIAWLGMVTPKGTPKDILNKIAAELSRTLKDPTVRQRIVTAGMQPVDGSTPDNFAAFLREEVVRWGQRVKDAGLQME